MVTLFTVPKYFTGHFDIIQRNAIESWTRLPGAPQIILLGSERGTATVAREMKADHVRGLRHNVHGSPYLDSAFRLAFECARHELVIYVNSDIILFPDLCVALKHVKRYPRPFMLAGERIDLDLTSPIDFTRPRWTTSLLRRAYKNGVPHGFAGVDYFVFHRDQMPSMPPFVIGRTCYDNWLFWKMLDEGRDIIDATEDVVSIHQNHPRTYSSLGRPSVDGSDFLRHSSEARANRLLAGNCKERILNIRYATHILRDGKIEPATGAKYLTLNSSHDPPSAFP